MKNLTSIIAALTLSLASGCAFLDALTPHLRNSPKIDPILPIKTTAPFYSTPNDKIYRIAKDVTKSTETYFPQGRVISLGEKEGKSRYLTSRVIQEKGDRGLELLFFIGSDEKTRIIIEEQLSNNKHGPAADTLKTSNYNMTAIYDPRINTSGEKIDQTYSFTNKDGRITSIKIKGSSKEKEVIETYLTLLEKIDSSPIKTNPSHMPEQNYQTTAPASLDNS